MTRPDDDTLTALAMLDIFEDGAGLYVVVTVRGEAPSEFHRWQVQACLNCGFTLEDPAKARALGVGLVLRRPPNSGVLMLNKVTLIGNLGADPEVRTAQSGNQIANLRVATSDRQKDASGNWTDHTEWHRVVCFGRTAENVGKFLRKGSKVYVEGKIQTRKWTNKEGQDQYTTEIVAFDVKFLDSKGGGERQGGAQREDGYGGDASKPDDDIPF